MRRQEQLSLVQPWIAHPHARELEVIGQILDSEPRIAARIEQELLRGVTNPDRGRLGMTGNQVLRVMVIKQLNSFSYEDLEFHLMDSASYRTFCGFGFLEPLPSRSALGENLKKVKAIALEEINQLLIRIAERQKVEDGRKVRVDSTGVETNIHHPSDSTLLYDGVRVLARLLRRARKLNGFRAWRSYAKSAKLKMRAISKARKVEDRVELYKELLAASRRMIRYAKAGAEALGKEEGREAVRIREKLVHFAGLLEQVITQTERRVLEGETVPMEEKLVSMFEEHTKILPKRDRETVYGHKVNLTGGASGLILDCVIEDGNPADSTRCVPMLKRQAEVYDRLPREAAFDGGYASRENLRQAKELGVERVCFSKKGSLTVEEMTGSKRIYNALQRFRAGIEGGISYLKRVFGLSRCTWKGEPSFHSYVWGSIVAANLLTLARHLLV
jgi:transposase, IS5 family